MFGRKRCDCHNCTFTKQFGGYMPCLYDEQIPSSVEMKYSPRVARPLTEGKTKTNMKPVKPNSERPSAPPAPAKRTVSEDIKLPDSIPDAVVDLADLLVGGRGLLPKHLTGKVKDAWDAGYQMGLTHGSMFRSIEESDPRARVCNELKQLSERLESLNSFIESESYKKLPAVQRVLLKEQSMVMTSYKSILTNRLQVWDQPESTF